MQGRWRLSADFVKQGVFGMGLGYSLVCSRFSALKSGVVSFGKPCGRLLYIYNYDGRV